MSVGFRFPRIEMPPEAEALRAEVRAFLADEVAAGAFNPRPENWMFGSAPEFSRKLGARGWIGMVWPKKYGGHERSQLERYVVTEELLAAGAPVIHHWVGDRQTGPLLLRFGQEWMREELLPRIATGELSFAIGMSEPDSGSDLASVRTAAVPVEGGWRITGRKIWTSLAHKADYIILFARTKPSGDGARHDGFSQFLVKTDLPGLSMRPIHDMANVRHFNEVVFDDVFVPESHVVGAIGEGWKQVVSELAYERSGPDRFLTTFPLLPHLMRDLDAAATGGIDERAALTLGRMTAGVKTMRRISQGIMELLRRGESPETEAALSKEVGTRFERELLEAVRLVVPGRPLGQSLDPYADALAFGTLHGPAASIRGGTNEILKGIVARELGLR